MVGDRVWWMIGVVDDRVWSKLDCCYFFIFILSFVFI